MRKRHGSSHAEHAALLSEIAGAVVARTMDDLPVPVRHVLSRIPILLERLPSREDILTGLEPDTLGRYEEDEQGLARIRIWIENVWDYSDCDEGIFREEIQTTLLHEIGHALGWDEDDLEERGLG